jgi:carbonic anhydrase
VVFHYGTNSTFTAEVWNTQHVIEVCVPKKAEGSESDDHECKGKADRDFYITIPGQEKEFYLKEFHLHAPAEHTYNGQERDLEVHLVHVAKDGATAVIGILMRKAGTDGNAVIKDVMDNVPLGGSEITVNPNLLVATATGFYSYQGSLTTPPCTQGVSWFVATTPGPVNGDDVTKLHRIIKAFKGYGPYENNNRRPMPVRHLNEGEVVLVGRGDGASK